jgi:DNA-binding HxlR family transcriptional regulator
VSDHRARSEDRALGDAVARVGDRWALLLVHALLDGPRRFNDLLDDLGGIAPNILSQRLKHLERAGVVTVTPYSTRPPRYVYELTAAGRDLAGAVRLLAQWGAGRSDGSEPLRHQACGTAMEARWYCPTCASIVDDAGGEEDLRFV